MCACVCGFICIYICIYNACVWCIYIILKCAYKIIFFLWLYQTTLVFFSLLSFLPIITPIPISLFVFSPTFYPSPFHIIIVTLSLSLEPFCYVLDFPGFFGSFRFYIQIYRLEIRSTDKKNDIFFGSGLPVYFLVPSMFIQISFQLNKISFHIYISHFHSPVISWRASTLFSFVVTRVGMEMA